MNGTAAFAAVDLGASSGRIMVVSVGSTGLGLREVHRFSNRPVRVGGTLYWDVLSLWSGVLDGLHAAASSERLTGIGIDSWAVDYGLLDERGELLGNPVHYRDSRTVGVLDVVAQMLRPDEQYDINGIQQLPFNTVYQLVAARDTAALRHAEQALLVPDLFSYWLTGQVGTELTNASTTALLDARSRDWSYDLADRLNVPVRLFPPLCDPGTARGRVRAEVADTADLRGVDVFAVGSHDTASAVVGVPAETDRFAFISSGTWSLVGVEVQAPILTSDARAANFSNELGVDGTVRFLRNVSGLWLLQESVRTWQSSGQPIDLPALLAAAAALPGKRSVIDPALPDFLAPGDMPERIRRECKRTGQRVPATPVETTRCILDSLAEAYRTAVRQAAQLAGVDIEVVHVVGGGAQNSLLCQLTADACDLPVVAGPVEAAVFGNALVQARAAGAIDGSLSQLRALIPRSALRRYQPRG